MSVTVASYNIHKAVGNDLRFDPGRILDVIDEIGADIAVLQEADRRFGARQATLPAALLAERGWQVAPLAERSASIGWHGNAILVSDRVTLERAARLPLPALEPRGAVLADVRVDGHLLRLVGAHLDLSGLWRTRQINAIVDAIARQPAAPPVLVMGDMNEWRLRSPGLASLASAYPPVPLAASFPSRMPIGQLDRVFASRSLTIEEAGVHRSALARRASDHLPVWVRLGAVPGLATDG
ncbi:endonuclease/exonuclease/phosphatase family protein [Polymorphobacter sp.]|uniref:endonuclease/exonuclease/phosphatase family protein n=1 Tax=Polymorphobacter sp. TaxID=1909290 RepID=UPI003F72FF97